MERTGWFECSDPLINRLHENVVWSMRGNFLGIPTDCPQRDERVGWTGDIQVFSSTASYLYDVAGFLFSWLADLAAEQKSHGVVPFFVAHAKQETRSTRRGLGRCSGNHSMGALPTLWGSKNPGRSIRKHAAPGWIYSNARPAGTPME